MKITKIEEQKKKKNRVSVYVDDEFSFGISANLLVDLDLFKGKEVSAKDIENYKSSGTIEKCLASAYRFLSYRPRSEKEIIDRLNKNYDPEIVTVALKKLQEYNYINDADFSRSWISCREGGRGRRMLQFELKKKGISEEIIKEALYDLDADKELECATALVKSKQKYQNLPEAEKYSKVGGFLSRRGYGYDIIKKVLKEI